MGKLLVMDVGNGTLRYACADEGSMTFSNRGRTTIDTESKENLFNTIADICDLYRDEVYALSITLPGVIDRRKGFAYSGGMFRWVRNMDYAGELSEKARMPVYLCNDAKAAAMAEVGYGNLRNISNGIMLLVLGTGVGGAIVINGKLLDGDHFAAGEVSYMRDLPIDSDIFGLSARVDALSNAVERTAGISNLNLIRMFMMVREGNEDVIRGVNEWCYNLANYIYNIQCVVDATRVVIGGSISDEPMLMNMIREAVKKRFDEPTYQNTYMPEIMECCFHSNARMYGAVYNVRELTAEK